MSSLPNATPPNALSCGNIIGGKYRIDGVLGSGGMGIVLSATHLELDAPVAIKVVREELAQSPEIASRLLFEARAVARMTGAHVVRILDVDRLDSGIPYIVMEQLQGADLASLIAEGGALSVRDAVHYLLQACEGLREAHDLGIIHRDLKPENLFLASTREGVVLKILDFGISKYVGRSLEREPRSTLTKSGTAVGSPFYMAPEQMRASPDLDARADIWSLGAILYELLTGKCPFEAESPAALCAKVMVEAPPSLRAFSESIPLELDDILHCCLEKDRAARYQSVAQLEAALREFAAGQAAHSQRLVSGIELREPPPAEGRGTLMALCGVCVMLAIAGFAFWQLQGRASARPVLAASTLSGDMIPNRPAPPLPTAEPEPRDLPLHVTVTPAGPLPSQPRPAQPEVTQPLPAITAIAVATPAPSATAETPPPAPQPTAGSATNSGDPAARYGL